MKRESLGNRLRRIRLLARQSQTHVATAIGVNQATVSRVELGRYYSENVAEKVRQYCEQAHQTYADDVDKIATLVATSDELRALIRRILSSWNA